MLHLLTKLIEEQGKKDEKLGIPDSMVCGRPEKLYATSGPHGRKGKDQVTDIFCGKVRKEQTVGAATRTFLLINKTCFTCKDCPYI